MDKLLKPLSNKKKLEPGLIIRRIGNGKDQQGCFLEYDEEKNIILADIIDMAEGKLIANKGVLKPHDGDKLYYYESSFATSPDADKALEIIKNWSLYKDHKALRDQIINFASISFVPEQILEMSRKETLHLLFVPLQQKFCIGRFTNRRTPERVCNETFVVWLESMQRGNHITYIALILQQKHHIPRFYSVGTKPHEETATLLKEEPFNFAPTHGGHIKAVGTKDDKKHFLVDGGSTYLGQGIKTPLHISEAVTAALKKLYPEFEFTAMEGRGAFGTEQSY